MGINWYPGVLICIFLIISRLNIFCMFLHPFIIVYLCLLQYTNKQILEWCKAWLLHEGDMHIHESFHPFLNATFSVRPSLLPSLKLKLLPCFIVFVIFVTFHHMLYACYLCIFLLSPFLIRMKPLRSKYFWSLKNCYSVLYLQNLVWAWHIVIKICLHAWVNGLWVYWCFEKVNSNQN